LPPGEAKAARRRHPADLDHVLGSALMEIISAPPCYLDRGRIDWAQFRHRCEKRPQRAKDRGFTGLRSA
jgi:hypothetical protein